MMDLDYMVVLSIQSVNMVKRTSIIVGTLKMDLNRKLDIVIIYRGLQHL